MTGTRRQRLRAALAAPVDPASLVVFRVAFGLLMLVAVARFFAHGWIASYYLEPTHFFSYAGFAWVKPWPGDGMYVHFAVMGVCAVLVAIGLWYRVAAVGFGLLFGYAHLCDKTNYLNHYYLLIVLALLLAALPLGDVGSVDAWRRARRGAPAPTTLPAWVVWTLRAQLAVVYLYGGVAKLQADWLVHAQPLKAWLAASGDVPVLGPVLVLPATAYVMSWAGAIFDLTIPLWLTWRRSRPFGYAAVVLFHVLTARLFHLGMFPWVMIALTTIFFAPDWPRRLWARARRAPVTPAPAGRPSAPPRLLAIVLGAHLALQLLLPLRARLYPGNTLWTEEGFRFSWSVMVMEKSGVAEFVVRDPDTGTEWRVPARTYYTRYQAAMMATQPDMILEAAHVVADDFRRRGVRRPEVRADVMVSLNGRPRQRLVDLSVDLARERTSLAPYAWILPAPEAPPP